MSHRYKKTIIFFGLILLCSLKVQADPLRCPSPMVREGSAWCDATTTGSTTSRYDSEEGQGVVCLAEPPNNTSHPIDAEIIGAGACILGKFKTPNELQKLVDFVIAYDFRMPSSLLESFENSGGIYVPRLETLPATGEFMTTVPLEREGVYDLLVQGRVLNDDGSFKDIQIHRSIIRVAPPHLIVTRARVAGSAPACNSPTETGCLQVNPMETPRESTATQPVHRVQLVAPERPTTSVNLCVNSHDNEQGSGRSVLVRAVNTITDSSTTPAREIIVDATCAERGNEFCAQDSSDFCQGGYQIKVPVGHGRNKIDLFVSNLVTGRDIGAAERITIDAFDIDLKGPSLCVNYLNTDGEVIRDVDNNKLLTSEARESVMLDVTLGACGRNPETVSMNFPDGCDPEDPPAVIPTSQSVCGNSAPVCMRRNNEKTESGAVKYVALCETTIGGQKHYRAKFTGLGFPINTAVIGARDNQGNETIESHSFGYGNVRGLFDNQGELDLQQAMIPEAMGGFLSAPFLSREVRSVINRAVNSQKFKRDLFPKLLDPHQPTTTEISCLRGLAQSSSCTYDHLASLDRVVAIKLFCHDDNCGIGNTSITSLQFLDPNTIRLQLRIDGLRVPGEMYTIQFINSDDDIGRIVDTEDADADNDGICDQEVPHVGKCTDANHDNVCDEEVGLSGSAANGLDRSGRCVLDKSISVRDCSDSEPGDRYWGCSDQDDDNDGIPDSRDLPGRIVPDPDYGTYVIPIRLAMRQAALNLDVRFSRDSQRKLKIDIRAIPGMRLFDARSDRDYLIEFDCGKSISEIYQGGRVGDIGNGQHLWIDTEACNSLQSANETANSLRGANEGWFGDFFIPDSLVRPRAMSDVNQQLRCTIQAVAQCSMPSRIEAMLATTDRDKVMPISLELQNKKFHMDLFSPLRDADIHVDSLGVGFSGKGLLLPAGVTAASDMAERDSRRFMPSLPEGVKNNKFGPLSRRGGGEPWSPAEAAYLTGNEFSLALNEETINSVMQAVNTLLWQLSSQEPESGLLDMSERKIREDFDMAIPNIGGAAGCFDENGNDVPSDYNWKCFPFALNIFNVFGGDRLNYIDFNGNKIPGDSEDLKTPLIIRNEMNLKSPPTVKIVDVVALGAPDEGGARIRSRQYFLELEIGMGNARMVLFEGRVARNDWSAVPLRGTGQIKNWCDEDRFPGANPAICNPANVADRPNLPIVAFGVSGRVFVTVLLTVDEDGLIRVEGGVSSVVRENPASGELRPELDEDKTYLNVTTLENNTIKTDNDLADGMAQQLKATLGKYLFGMDRDVRINIPAQVPLEAYCSRYSEQSPDLCRCVENPDGEDCEDVGTVQDLWDQLNLDEFGINGLTIQRPSLGRTTDELPTHFLTIGSGVLFDLSR